MASVIYSAFCVLGGCILCAGLSVSLGAFFSAREQRKGAEALGVSTERMLLAAETDRDKTRYAKEQAEAEKSAAEAKTRLAQLIVSMNDEQRRAYEAALTAPRTVTVPVPVYPVPWARPSWGRSYHF